MNCLILKLVLLGSDKNQVYVNERNYVDQFFRAFLFI